MSLRETSQCMNGKRRTWCTNRNHLLSSTTAHKPEWTFSRSARKEHLEPRLFLKKQVSVLIGEDRNEKRESVSSIQGCRIHKDFRIKISLPWQTESEFHMATRRYFEALQKFNHVPQQDAQEQSSIPWRGGGRGKRRPIAALSLSTNL